MNATCGEDDIAGYTLVVGQPQLTNVVLDRGYSRDLPQLKRMLEIVQFDAQGDVEKRKALTKIDARLMGPAQVR